MEDNRVLTVILKYHNNQKVVIDDLCLRQSHEEKGLYPVAWEMMTSPLIPGMWLIMASTTLISARFIFEVNYLFIKQTKHNIVLLNFIGTLWSGLSGQEMTNKQSITKTPETGQENEVFPQISDDATLLSFTDEYIVGWITSLCVTNQLVSEKQKTRLCNLNANTV